VPQVFPWQQRSATTSAPTHAHILSPTDIVYHDHTYFAQPPDLPSTHLTPLIESSVASSPFTLDVSTQTSLSHFCIEDIADNDTAVHFYTGFSDYRMLIICFEFFGKAVYHLKYWGSISTVPSMEKRGASRSLSPLNEFFLVLCRLRCGFMETDLAFQFKVSQSTVSRIIITWINFL
jgi:hypothetical protein